MGEAQEFKSVALLRGVACLLVVWSHFAARWKPAPDATLHPISLVHRFVTTPLAIIQDFGALGVAIFFFISGFIITHVAQRETRRVFVLRRLLRIYPPLIVCLLLSIPVMLLSSYTLLRPGEQLAPVDVLGAFTLLNYFFLRTRTLLVVGWTLAIELCFYMLVALLHPIIKRWPGWSTALMAGTVWLVVYFSGGAPQRGLAFPTASAFLPLLLVGKATNDLWARRIKGWHYALLVGGCYLIFSASFYRLFPRWYGAQEPYIISVLYAYLIFVCCLLLEPRLVLPRPLAFYSTISYSLYLYHHQVVNLIYEWLGAAGFLPTLLVAFVLATLVSYLAWRCVEQPAQHLARRLVRSSSSVTGATPPASLPATSPAPTQD